MVAFKRYIASFLFSLFEEDKPQEMPVTTVQTNSAEQKRIAELEMEVQRLQLENSVLLSQATEAVDRAKTVETEAIRAEAVSMRRLRILEDALCRAAANVEQDKPEIIATDYKALIAKVFLEFPEVRNKYGPRLS